MKSQTNQRALKSASHFSKQAVLPVIEMMERRTLLSGVTLGSDGTLTVTGTNDADDIEITLDNGGANGDVVVTLNGVKSSSDATAVQKIVVNALGGDDNMMVDGFTEAGIKPTTLKGGDGNDTFLDEREDGQAVENGGNGNDTFLWFEDAHATVTGGAGTDTINTGPASLGGPLTVNLNKGGGVTEFTGDGAVSFPNADVENAIIPSDGWSSVQVTGNGSNNNINVDGGGADFVSISGGGGNDTIVANGSISITLNGDDGNDSLSANAGSFGKATLNGGSGNDTLKGGHEADFFSGGAGFDVVDYSARTANLSVSIGTSANDGETNEHDNVWQDVEEIIGGSGNDYLQGNDSANILIGNAGNDTLIGLGGNDTLYGNAGVDKLYGNTGNDTIFAKDGIKDFVDGGNGTDTAQTDLIDTVVNTETVTH